MAAGTFRDSNWGRLGGLIASCTLVLTASFVGILAFASGNVEGLPGRIPWYLIVAAVVFVATIVLLEGHDASGGTIIVTAFVIGSICFLGVTLSVEGVIFAVRQPRAAVSQLLLYFLAAALVATGIGYWGLNHWREFTARQNQLRR